jgi:uncharacterized damage-inducible protein DinB
MDLLQHFERLFAHEAWANRATLASLGDAVRPSDRALRIQMHVYAAERLWLARLAGEPSPWPVWPEATLAACRDAAGNVDAYRDAFLAGLKADELQRLVQYTNSQGDTFTNTVHDILVQMLLHSAYHRGQIASELRGAGDTPALTDYIHCVRQGFLS